MDVLLTNDDGIRATGLRVLYTALREAGHTPHVVAPMYQQSGVGHSLTVFEPLRAAELVEENGFKGLGVYGTPTDCVKLALARILPKAPDMVISGINAGPNVGPDILYSGTVGAATEAAHEDLPSIAVSHNDHHCGVDLLPHARHLVALAERFQRGKLGPRRVININYPAGECHAAKGLRICQQTSAVWKNIYLERNDPRGAPYWWLEGEIPLATVNEGSDKHWLDRGYITVTPLRFEFTDHEGMSALEDMWGDKA